MRIITQGTSHGNHTYNRFNSSTLVEVEDVSYLIDAGAPANGLMIRANKELHKLQAVFITHMHEDHTGGLPGIIKTLLKKPRDDQHTVILLPEENAISPLESWLKAMHLKWPSSIVSLITSMCFFFKPLKELWRIHLFFRTIHLFRKSQKFE